MDARMQKHRITRWVGRLFTVLSLVASCGAHAVLLDAVQPDWKWCYGVSCVYSTDLEAAQAYSALSKASYDQYLAHPYASEYPHLGYVTLESCDGNGWCHGTTTFPNSVRHPYFSQQPSDYIFRKEPTCRAPTTYPTIPYEYVPGISSTPGLDCIRFIPGALTITLSGGTSVEPWHKKSDADHKKTNLPYTATVKDTSGQPAPNVEVTVTTEVIQDSGGHVHIDGRPKGKLAIPSKPIKDGKETITGNTDNNGVYSFVFGSEEASGTHTLTAKCSTGCEAPATATVKVEIKGLSLLDRDPLSYTLNGETSTHPGSHYFSAAAMTKIINLAFGYSHDPALNKQLLIINDSSLIKGGTFDVLQDWTSMSNVHGGHRVGVVVDINNFSAPSPKFEELAARYRIDAKWHKKGTAPHYHLWLLGKDQ